MGVVCRHVGVDSAVHPVILCDAPLVDVPQPSPPFSSITTMPGGGQGRGAGQGVGQGRSLEEQYVHIYSTRKISYSPMVS